MKFIFLYISEYKTLKNEKVVFDQRYSLTRSNKLLKKTDTFHKYLNINTISAFVGKNGTGKSTLLEFLLKIISGGDDIFNYQFVFEYKGEVYNIGDEFIEVSADHYNETIPQKVKRNTNFIYYSPIYNPHSGIAKKIASVQNISSDSIYRYKRSKNVEEDLKIQIPFLQEKEKFSNKYLDFEKYLDVDLVSYNPAIIKRRAIKALNDLVILPLEKKEYLLEKSNDYRLKENSSFKMFLNSLKGREQFDDYEYFLEKITETFDEFLHFYETRRISDKYEYLEFQILFKMLIDNTQINYSKQKAELIFRRLHLLFSYVDILRDSIDFTVSDFLNRVELVSENENIILRYEESHKQLKKILRKNKSRNFPLSFRSDEYDEALLLISKIRRDGLENFFRYSWRGISSGQLTKLNFYSRLHSAMSSKKNSLSTVFIFDEADIYLHPEWQRTFFDDLNDFFCEYDPSSRKMEYNIILTTHSPMMISDLYDFSVFRFGGGSKDGMGKIKKSSSHTFAANLFDLFEDEFDVKTPRGALATKILNNLLKEIDKKQVSSDVEWKISQVGESIIQRGLERKLNDQHQNK